MSTDPATRWRQVQQSFPMNCDPARAVYKQCWEKLLVSPYKPQLAAVKANWEHRVRGVWPLPGKEKSKAGPDIQPLNWYYHPEEHTLDIERTVSLSLTQHQFLFFLRRNIIVAWLNHLWERTTMSQSAYVNKPLDMNWRLKEIEDQRALFMGTSNFKIPPCLLNKIQLVQRRHVLALLSAKKPDHSDFGPLRVHLH